VRFTLELSITSNSISISGRSPSTERTKAMKIPLVDVRRVIAELEFALKDGEEIAKSKSEKETQSSLRLFENLIAVRN
jgi:hypothetical protein